MQKLKDYYNIIKMEPINKGWSSDKKYYVETADGRKLLLRVSNICEYNNKKLEFELVKEAAALEIPMSQPVDFGLCNNGQNVYSLLTWCEGQDAEVVLPCLQEEEQYMLGIKSGQILRLIHSLPAPKEQEAWNSRFNHKINNKIDKYKNCGIKLQGDDKIINYIENNRHLIDCRPQSYQHGDYHVGNMIISSDNSLSIIDFNRPDFGDPWEEFNRIVWSAAVSPNFATGQINGYFGGKPPMEFFKLLALYISSNTLSSIYWAIPFGDEEVTTMKNQAKEVLTWFDNMNNSIPTWYIES